MSIGTQLEESPDAWVLRFEKTLRAARSSSIRMPKIRVVYLCLLVRVAVKMIQYIDKGETDKAREALDLFVKTLDEAKP